MKRTFAISVFLAALVAEIWLTVAEIWLTVADKRRKIKGTKP